MVLHPAPAGTGRLQVFYVLGCCFDPDGEILPLPPPPVKPLAEKSSVGLIRLRQASLSSHRLSFRWW